MPNENTTNVKFSRGQETNLPEVQDGQIVFTTDTGKLYIDNGTNRTLINDDSNFVHKTGQEVITGEKRFNGFIRTQGGRYVHICYPGVYSELGWYKFATIQLISGQSVGVPFCFIVSLVGQEQYTKVYVVFDPNDDSDPNLLHLTSEGLCEVAIHKSQTNYWDLYVKKEILSQSTLMVHDFISPSYGFNITWTREIVTTLPEGAIECTHIPTAEDAYDYIDQEISGITVPVAETDANVETMLNSFNLDYTSSSSSPNFASGVSF